MPAAVSGAPASADAMAATPVATATGPDLVWTAPAHWQAQEASAMRKGSYLVPGGDAGGDGDMSITAFPGDAGGFLANVNRWRGQIGLSALSQEAAGELVSHLDIGTLHVDVIDFSATSGNPAQRVLGGITSFNGSTWFFKLSGPDLLLAREKPAFMAFIQSLRAP
jgi:hypothetical protein